MTPPRDITPRSALRGRFRVPGSKSITNRALVCAALAEGESTICNASDSTDSAMMANGLNQLGIQVIPREAEWRVEGKGGRLFAPKFPIPVGNAGTTLRFFLSVAALADGKVVFEGDPRMGERPNDELVAALHEAGVKCVAYPDLARFEVTGGGLRGGTIRVRQEKSSQFLSSLLLVAPYASGKFCVQGEGERSSRSYVEMTLRVMEAFGVVPVVTPGGGYLFASPLRYRPVRFEVEPDASGASYGLAAAAIAGGEVCAVGVRRNSCQGDAAFVELLEAMGCRVEERPEGVVVQREGVLRGIDCDMNGMPDVVPTLCVTALFADGPTRIRNVAHLRFKESDRLEVLGAELRKLGAQLVIHGDGVEVVPAPLHGALLSPRSDHRMAMAFALAGLRVPGIRVEEPECVRKSFPRFWDEFEQL